MSAIVNTNLNALSAQRQSGQSATQLASAIQRLSSGLRINSAKDDAAGLAIAERFTAQIKGTDQAARNANDGISLVQTAEGALGSISSNLQRIRELAVQSANGTNSATDRAALQAESQQLIGEIDRIATQTEFNGNRLLNGSFTGQQFQMGANAGETVTVAAIPNVRSSVLGHFYGRNQTYAVTWDPAPETLEVQRQFPVAPFSDYTYVGAIISDAKAIAAALNTGAVPGLTATALATNQAAAATQTSTGTANGTGVLSLNGVSINLTFTDGGGPADAQNRSAAVAAINAQTAQTGVVAADTGVGVSLAAADGRNIVTSYAAGTATASSLSDFGLAAAGTSTGSVAVDFHDPSLGGVSNMYLRGAGLTGHGVYAGGTSNLASGGASLSLADISTVAGANAAIPTVDEALARVSTARATLGAVQNRFQSAIANLQTGAENLSASRSRIQDADFALETANLSRTQILQQAGTAMVVQANQSPQGVLALLR